jgi:hypothetical protein
MPNARRWVRRSATPLHLRREHLVTALMAKKGKRNQNTYCIRFHPDIKRRHGFGGTCVITARRYGRLDYEGLVDKDAVNDLPLLNLAGFEGLSPPSARLRAIARVLTDKRRPEHEFEVDETIRTALGIPMDEEKVTEMFEISIWPLKISIWDHACDLASRLVGYRHMYARVGVGFIADIDKPICRVPIFAFPLLGIEDGGGVVCEAVCREGTGYKLNTIPLRAYSINAEIQAERKQKEQDKAQRRFRSSEELLGLKNELPRVFIGHGLREQLKSGDLDAIRIRRQATHILLREALAGGIVAALSLIATLNALFTLGGRIDFIRRWVEEPLGFFCLLAVFGVILPGLLIIVRVRTRV